MQGSDVLPEASGGPLCDAGSRTGLIQWRLLWKFLCSACSYWCHLKAQVPSKEDWTDGWRKGRGRLQAKLTACRAAP